MLKKLRIPSRLAAALCLLLSLEMTGAVAADAFPARPITIVVPIASGGSTDVITRLIATHMTKTLGQPIVVENLAGAGGVVGSTKVARSAPDGYTLVAGSSGSQASVYSFYEKVPYTPESFSQIGLMAIIPAVIVVNSSLPVRNIAELVSYAKSNPSQKVTLGNPGAGTSGHLQCEYLKAVTGVDFTMVPYRGAGPMLTDLMAGHIQGACDATPSSGPAVQSGHIRAIAVLGGERATAMPDVSTAVEQNLPQLQSPAWVGLSAPKGTPAPVLNALQSALSAALDDPGVRAGIAKMGANVPTPRQRGLQFTDDFVRNEVQTWATLAKAANVVKQ